MSRVPDMLQISAFASIDPNPSLPQSYLTSDLQTSLVGLSSVPSNLGNMKFLHLVSSLVVSATLTTASVLPLNINAPNDLSPWTQFVDEGYQKLLGAFSNISMTADDFTGISWQCRVSPGANIGFSDLETIEFISIGAEKEIYYPEEEKTYLDQFHLFASVWGTWGTPSKYAFRTSFHTKQKPFQWHLVKKSGIDVNMAWNLVLNDPIVKSKGFTASTWDYVLVKVENIESSLDPDSPPAFIFMFYTGSLMVKLDKSVVVLGNPFQPRSYGRNQTIAS